LSPRTVGHIRAVLRTALNQAIKWGLLTCNVAALVESPQQHPNRTTLLTADEARLLLQEASSRRLAALLRIAMTMGLREGELLGLQWRDLDLESRTLSVTRVLPRVDGRLILKEPKSAKSRRTLTLPRSLVQPLQAHRVQQELERTAAGLDWMEHDLVFPSSKGTPLDPRNLLRTWHNLLEKAGLPRRSFHSTRDTAGSLLLAEDVDVSDRRRDRR
jgi:integrase